MIAAFDNKLVQINSATKANWVNGKVHEHNELQKLMSQFLSLGL